MSIGVGNFKIVICVTVTAKKTSKSGDFGEFGRLPCKYKIKKQPRFQRSEQG